jgi:cytochrome b subunit of formate dehydrogenase
MMQTERFLRFPLARRIEHWTMVISFTILAITGLSQKFQLWAISEFFLRLLGGIESVRIIHRVAAVVLMIIAIYHLGVGIYNWFVNRRPLDMFPGWQDLQAAWDSLRYNLRLSIKKPKQGFYTFEEKFEYWALVWGTILMAVTGFFLWNPITAAKFLPGEWIPAAKAAHGNEALLAVIAILLWHMYHVLIKHFNTSMFFGYMTREEMEEFHPLVLEAEPYETKKDEAYQRRKRTFSLVYGLLSIAMLTGIYWFVSSEETAVGTPEQIPDLQGLAVFSRLDPTPYPDHSLDVTPVSIGDTWTTGIGALFNSRCGRCHNPIDGRSHLDLRSYSGITTGGDSGPAITPGASGVSLVVIWQSRGDHPGQFSPGELAAVRDWIDNYAPEE